jgi:endoglucanase
VCLGAGAAGGLAPAGASPRVPEISTPLSISIVGNHFVNGVGQTIRLLGVDRPGTEYACEQGWGFSNGDDDPADAAADAASIAVWDANAVRIPLNEDCWLGLNGEPAYRPNSDTQGQAQAAYRQTIETYVADLNADGIYAILDLHWSAPGSVVADGQRSMPDDHSAAFWTSVAGTFEGDRAVVFDVFNEPFSPADDGSEYSAYPVSWSCWLNGGCTVPDAADGDAPVSGQTYTAVGMQTLVNAIRASGATQPIMVGGLSYANDLSGWLANEPSDPDGQLAASLHVYEGESCDDVSCWDSTVAPVAAQVPVVTGEFDQDECPVGADDWDGTFMDWADQTGVSYLAWGWYAGATPDCSGYYLLDAAGDPQAPNGTALQAHLALLAQPTRSTTTAPVTTPVASPPASPPVTEAPVEAPVNRPVSKPACTVPKLVGDSLAAATRRLKSSHCRLGRVRKPRNGTRLVVASSNPRAGKREKNGTRVALRMRYVHAQDVRRRHRDELAASPG